MRLVLPNTKLKNGLVVANYSSPHPFTFEDGSILEACSKERSILTMLTDNEKVTREYENHNDIIVSFKMTWFLKQEFKYILSLQLRDKLLWDVITSNASLERSLYRKQNHYTWSLENRQNN